MQCLTLQPASSPTPEPGVAPAFVRHLGIVEPETQATGFGSGPQTHVLEALHRLWSGAAQVGGDPLVPH